MKKKALPQLFIYDLDGTLIDSVPSISQAINLALQETFAITAPEALVRSWVGNGSKMLASRAHTYAKQTLGEAATTSHTLDALHHGFLHHYACHINSPNPVFEGVRTLLNRIDCAGIAQAIATNKPQQFVPALLKNAGLTPYVSAIVGGNSLPERKPHPMPLEYLCRRFNCQPHQAIMIGDSESDAMSAQRAGMPCWLVEQGYSQGIDLHKLGAQKVFKDMQVLLSHVETLFSR